jgi:hypothetical protein
MRKVPLRAGSNLIKKICQRQWNQVQGTRTPGLVLEGKATPLAFVAAQCRCNNMFGQNHPEYVLQEAYPEIGYP